MADIHCPHCDRNFEIAELAYVDREAKLPRNPFELLIVDLPQTDIERLQNMGYLAYRRCQQDMLKNGWVKEKE